MRKVQTSSNSEIVSFYKRQLKKFDKIGIGSRTEHGVIVTQKLIDITQMRLNQLIIRRVSTGGYGEA